MPDILIATDSAAVFDELRSIVDGPETTVRWVSRGEQVRETGNARPTDLALVDSQIGTMGGIASTFIRWRSWLS